MRVKAKPAVIAVLFAFVALGQDVDRTYHFANTDTPQGMQEIATVIRTIADIPNLTADTTQRTLTFHSSAGAAALADWLFNELDKPANLPPQQTPDLAKHEYRVAGSDDDVVRVFYLTHTETLQNLQEVATVTRSIGGIRRLFTYNAPRAIVWRGTTDQAALAAWLLTELDKPANPTDSAVHEFHMAGTPENVVRVFYLDLRPLYDSDPPCLHVQCAASADLAWDRRSDRTSQSVDPGTGPAVTHLAPRSLLIPQRR